MRNPIRHGHARVGAISSEFHIWAAMLQRCTNERSKDWKYYGGRGVRVCDRWLMFDHFLADMGLKPDDHSIDRIDNNGNYEPGNCRWATKAQQSMNRRDVKATPDIVRAIRASTEKAHVLAARFGLGRSTVSKIKRGHTWQGVL